MTEQVAKYMARNARIFCVSLADAVNRSAELNHLTGEDRSLLGKLEVFACCIAALQKDEKASVTARLSLPGTGTFSATADKDGIVRGRKEEFCDGVEDTLEVTLQLHLRGNYTGMVTGKGLEGLVSAYFAQSLQIAACCKVFEAADGFYCIVAEQLPGEACDLAALCGMAAADLAAGKVPGEFEFLEATPLRFGCTCSRAALMRFVTALSPAEQADLAENGKIVTHCNACGKKYTFEI